MEKVRRMIQLLLSVGMMIFPLAANADEKPDKVNYEVSFEETIPICTNYFLPNSMARPPDFDLEKYQRNLESNLSNRAAIFRTEAGIRFLSRIINEDSDDIAIACAKKLLAESKKGSSNTPLEPSR